MTVSVTRHPNNVSVWDFHITQDNFDSHWEYVEAMYQRGIRAWVGDHRPEAHLRFHKMSMYCMVAAGMNRFRFITHVPTDSLVPLCTSRGDEELWWFVGSLTGCDLRLPCDPQILRDLLPYIPACSDPYLDQRSLSGLPELDACEVEACVFPVKQLGQFIVDAPKKQRSEWGRLLRKADLAGLAWRQVRGAEAIDIGRKLLPGYQEYWRNNPAGEDSYLNESVWCEEMLKIFEQSDYWLALVIEDGPGNPVAINFAWACDRGIYDAICIRNVSDKYKPYSLGILAVLFNIQLAHQHGWKRYSMAAGATGYKKQFTYASDPEDRCLALNVLSGIDVYLGAAPGFYHGLWYATPEQLPDLTPAYREWLRGKYEFLQTIPYHRDQDNKETTSEQEEA